MGKCYRQDDCRDMDNPQASSCGAGYTSVGFDARKCNWKDQDVSLLRQKETTFFVPRFATPFSPMSPLQPPYSQLQLHRPSLTFWYPEIGKTVRQAYMLPLEDAPRILSLARQHAPV